MVSGGADSLCLLHALVAIHDGPVGVASIDHGLRPEARGEVEAVRAIAAQLGCPFAAVALELKPGSGIPERAREARYAAARAIAARDGWDVIAAGHTASDQAETVIMRMARGTGRTGALGMAARSGDLVRPLLCVGAEETAAWCAAAGLVPATDPTNHDRSYTRVRARAVMDALAGLHPGAVRHVAELADRLRDEDAVLADAADAAWARCARGEGLDIAALAAEPEAMRRILVRRLVAAHTAASDALTASAVRRVLAVADGAARAEVAGAAIVRERGRIVVIGDPEAPPTPVTLPVPGAVRFGRTLVRGHRGHGEPPQPGRVTIVPAGRIEVRGPRDGDRIALPGGGHARVGRILQADGVPARLRAQVPVVVVDEIPVWVCGHRVSAGALAGPGEPAVVLEVLPA
jgi:tRNA(Ile)-lysidine synthase